jgi:hypothetical protein
MGKIDDMRRLREQQVAAAEQRNAKAAKAPKAATADAAPRAAEPTRAATKTKAKEPAAAPDDTQGTCPSCGKTKPLANGVMASHQKGFGKACPGSRKPPL